MQVNSCRAGSVAKIELRKRANGPVEQSSCLVKSVTSLTEVDCGEKSRVESIESMKKRKKLRRQVNTNVAHSTSTTSPDGAALTCPGSKGNWSGRSRDARDRLNSSRYQG